MEVAVKQERMCIYIHMYVYILCVYIKIKKHKDTGKGRKQKRGVRIRCSPRTTALTIFAVSLCFHRHGRGQSKGSEVVARARSRTPLGFRQSV